MKKYILVVLSILVLTSFVLATDITSNPLTIRTVNNSVIIISNYSLNNFNYTINITNNSIQDYSYSFNDYYVTNYTVPVDLQCVRDLLICTANLAYTNASYCGCQATLNTTQGVQNNLTQCLSTGKDKDAQISQGLSDLNACNLKSNGTSNQGWLWGLAGLGIASAFWNWRKIYDRVTDKTEKEFSRGTAR
jgi:hypothetical protein